MKMRGFASFLGLSAILGASTTLAAPPWHQNSSTSSLTNLFVLLVHINTSSLIETMKTLTKNLFLHYYSGDSYSTVGFSVTGAQPNTSNPIGNPAFPGDTTTNGLNWVSDASTVYNTSLVLSYDFAVAGATVDDDLVMAYLTTVPSFVQQVSEFGTYYAQGSGVYTASASSSVEWSSSNSLFTAWFGINDISNGYTFSNWTTTRPEVVSQYFTQADTLYSTYGARNFLFFNIPPLWKTPKFLATNATAQAQMKDEVETFNTLLSEGFSTFKEGHSLATAVLLDTQPIFDIALNDPTAYGSANAECYDRDGTTCLWWNDFHPGQAIHKLIGQAVANATGI